MTERPLTRSGRGESVAFAVVTVAAYVGFAAFAMLYHDGINGSARAGVPVDAVRALASAARDAVRDQDPPPARAHPPRRPGFPGGASGPPGPAVGRIIPEPGARPPGPPPAGPDQRLRFIVKFRHDEGARWWSRFQSDPGQTRSAFEDLARSNAAFAGMKLDQVSPSGEATLEYQGAAPQSADEQQKLCDQIVKRLGGADAVEYAEQNQVAGTEKQVARPEQKGAPQ